MSETNEPARSDADWCALAAIEALQAGRYALGAILARTAAQADRAARSVPGAGPGLVDQVAQLRHVPLIGSTREEHPARPGMGPTGDGDVDLAATAVYDATVQAAATQTSLQPVPPESKRCLWTANGVPGSECWGVIYVDQEKGAWAHLDPQLDQAHPACPIAPGQPL